MTDVVDKGVFQNFLNKLVPIIREKMFLNGTLSGHYTANQLLEMGTTMLEDISVAIDLLRTVPTEMRDGGFMFRWGDYEVTRKHGGVHVPHLRNSGFRTKAARNHHAKTEQRPSKPIPLMRAPGTQEDRTFKWLLSLGEETTTAPELAKKLKIQHNTMCNILTQLEGKGLAKRTELEHLHHGDPKFSWTVTPKAASSEALS